MVERSGAFRSLVVRWEELLGLFAGEDGELPSPADCRR